MTTDSPHRIKLYRYVIVLAMFFGLAFWLLDSLLNFYGFHEYLRFLLLETPDNLLDSILFQVSPYSLFVRVSFLVTSILGGIATIYVMRRQQRMDDALRASEARNRAILLTLPDVITHLNASGVYLDINMPHPARPDLSQKDIIGQRIDDVLPPTTVGKIHSLLVQALETDEMQVMEYDLEPAGGEKRYFEVRLVRITANEVLSIERDITESKQSLDALRDSEERFRRVIEQAPYGIVLANHQGDVIEWNPAQTKLSGIKREDAINQPVWDVQAKLYPLHERDKVAEQFRAGLQALLIGPARPPSTVPDTEIVTATGKKRVIQATSFMIETPFGRQVCNIIRDVTNLHEAEKQLAQDRVMLRTLIDTLPDFIFVKDAEGRFMMVNQRGIEGRGVDGLEKVLGKTDFDFVADRSRAEAYQREEKALIESGESSLNQEEYIVLADGRERWFLTSKVPFRDQRGEIVGLVGISRDITEHKRAEANRLELVIERERVKMLRRFIADVSHDFKTPLTTIQTSLYLLERTEDPDRREKRIETLKMQARNLTKMVEDMLNMSRLDAVTEFEFVDVDLNDLVREVVAELETAALHKKQTLTLQSSDELPAIEGDRVQLYRAISNLIENALHYTPEEGVISVETMCDNEAAVIRVKDTGIGISPEDQKRIFERFYRGDKARNVGQGGTGLGLAIAKKIIEIHHGQIDVRSETGNGSIFTIRIPTNGKLQ